MKVLIYPKGIVTHKRGDCFGQHCVIHSPSDHKMAGWPIFIRLDKMALAERTCPHGVGHPDPDSLAFFKWKLGERYANYAYTLGGHGCDGCCT